MDSRPAALTPARTWVCPVAARRRASAVLHEVPRCRVGTIRISLSKEAVR